MATDPTQLDHVVSAHARQGEYTAETRDCFSAITLRGWTATAGSLDPICWLNFGGADGDRSCSRFCRRYFWSATSLLKNAIAYGSAGSNRPHE